MPRKLLLIQLLLFSSLLSGCDFLLGRFSINLDNSNSNSPPQNPSNPEPVVPTEIVIQEATPIPAVINGASEIGFTWVASGEAASLKLEASDDDDSWVTVTTVTSQSEALSIEPATIPLADGTLNFRLTFGSQIIELGSAMVDRTGPTLSASEGNGIYWGCGPSSGTFFAATDNISAVAGITYEVIGVLPASLSGCLDGSNSTSCDWNEGALPPSVDYRAIDEAGNTTNGVLGVGFCL